MRQFPLKENGRRLTILAGRHRLRCVFVLSTGRVGTDSLTRVLDLASDIDAFHEPHPRFLKETAQSYKLAIGSGGSFGNDFLNARMLQYPRETTIWGCLVRRRIYAETSNRLTYAARQLAAFFPKSKFIFLHRDPADVVRSAMRRGYYATHSWDRHRIAPRPNDAASAVWDSWDPFEKCCWYWKAVNQIGLDLLAEFGESRVFNLPSESLFECEVDDLVEMFRWLGATAPTNEELRAVLSVKHNAQVQGPYPRWEEWPDDQRQRLAEIVAPVAEKLGYRLQVQAGQT